MRVCGAAVAGLIGLAVGMSGAGADPASGSAAPTGAVPVVVVTATRVEEPAFGVPYTVDKLGEESLAQSRSVPDALGAVPGVLVQKTAHGQGSPYIRGFTGFRTLMLVDGVRLNNSVFRDGANQYWSTIDPLALGAAELVQGPGSVLYGSDAVGGTAQVFSRVPRTGAEGGDPGLGGRLYARYASADESKVGRVEGSSAGADWAASAGISRKLFGDVRAGGDTGRQRETGYDETDADALVRYAPGAGTELTVGHQHVEQDDVWRTHKTIYGISWHGTTVGDERARTLDQERDLTYVRYRDGRGGALYDSLCAILSLHRQQEELFRVKKDGTGDIQEFDVLTPGVSLQLERRSRLGRFVYGFDYYRDLVDSGVTKLNADGSVKGYGIQGPVADNAAYDLAGVYVEDTLALTRALDLVLGVRGTYAAADAGQYEDPATGLPASESRDWRNVCGNARLVCWLNDDRSWNVYAGAAQAFRAPNLSDLSRLDSARTDEIETPSPDVDPERYLTGEAGTRLAAGPLVAGASYFYTRIDDLIVRTPTGRMIGDDREVTKVNASEGYVHGASLEAALALARAWRLSADVTWMEGYADSYGSTTAAEREPLRTMPLTASSTLRWEPAAGKPWIEVSAEAVDREDRLSEEDKRDTQRIPPSGTPGYAVFGVRGGIPVCEGLLLTLAVENLTDKDYRVHGSGSNEAGRNYIVAADCRF